MKCWEQITLGRPRLRGFDMPAVVDSTSNTSARGYNNGKSQKLSVPVIQPSVQPVQIMASVPSDKSALTYLG